MAVYTRTSYGELEKGTGIRTGDPGLFVFVLLSGSFLDKAPSQGGDNAFN